MQETRLVTDTFKTVAGRSVTIHAIPALVDTVTGEIVAYSQATVAALEQLKQKALKQDLQEMTFEPLVQQPDPVSRELRRALRAKGMTGAAVAQSLGVKPPLVSRWLSPDYHEHSVETLRRIAEALDMDLEISLKPRAS